MSKFWSWVKVSSGEVRLGKFDNLVAWEKIKPSDLPDWVKTKMAMLDLMEPLDKLPCASYRYLLANPNGGAVYAIGEDEDDRNN